MPQIAPGDVTGQVTVTDAQIQQDYDAHKATYVVPEKRDIQQIEFKTETEAKAARAQIDNGKSFDELAARHEAQARRPVAGHPDPDRPARSRTAPMRSSRCR